VATFEDGAKYTMAEFRGFFAALSPNQQQMLMKDPAEALHQLAVLRKMTQMAEEKKLQEQTPYKQAIEQQRMSVLSGALINETLNSFMVEPADIVKSYESNKNKYSEVKVKAIYIAYSDDAATKAAPKAKKPLTESEAKAKADKLLAQIKGGADFVKLVKENSDDEASREKDGDFPTLRPSDNIPDAFRAAIFSMKQGETTPPLKQPNGYYLLRVEQVTVKPLADVRSEIYNEIKDKRFAVWMENLNRTTKVDVTPAFKKSDK
jgi:parvulin-like peptidyl-prolyl isomerase